MPVSPHSHRVEFTRDGTVFDQAQVTNLLTQLDDYTDLIVLCHGWNNDINDADRLYDELTGSVRKVLEVVDLTPLQERSFGILRLFWPSKRFADQDLIPGGGMASATAENNAALEHLLEELKHDPVRLGSQERNPVREALLAQAQALVASLETDVSARRDFVFLLRALLDPAAAHPDDGSDEFFTRDPEELFADLAEPVPAPLGQGSGGATAITLGGAAGLIGDMLSGIRAAARRIANYTTYYEMKQRAGLVGRAGLAPVLQQIRSAAPQLRLHLVGHSFGARLVTAAGHALPSNTPQVSLILLQAAFSHNGFAENYEGDKDGAFRAVLGDRRVSGPILITHTKNDRAVGIAYPLASRIVRDSAAALGDKNDPYGGLGRNGAQRTREAEGLNGLLGAVGHEYTFTADGVYNLQADRFISDHSDITGPEVAYALLMASAAV